MRLEFVYKNLEHGPYDVIEGANFSVSYNEDLSSGTVLIHSEEPIDVESLDEIKILDLEVGTLYRCVDKFLEKELRNRSNDKVYEYRIETMSQTKLLECYTCPSLAITPKTNGGMSIYNYLVRYNNLYGPKVRTSSGFVNKFSFSAECATKFADTCPELQFNTPTLRECFTLLMQVKDCIPVLENNVISFIDISKKQTLRDKNSQYISYVERSQTSSEYTNSLKMNLKNVIQDNDYIELTEYMGIRNKDGACVNSDNMFLYTQHPIYEIVSFKVCFNYYRYWKVGNIEGGGNRYREEDLTSYKGINLIYEKKHWQTLEVIKTKYERYENLYKYQNSTLFYTIGSNVISNLSAPFTRGFFPTTVTTLEEILHGIMFEEDYLYDVFNAEIRPENRNFWTCVGFKITYKTKLNVLAKIEKEICKNNYRESIDNQSNNYVNAFTQGLLEYAKANRLGNALKTYYGRYPRNYEELPQAGDYFEGNEIIYKIDYQIWKEGIDITMYTCPNYVLRDYFTGVQSKLRGWKIVDTDEAFEREEHYKIYCEFDYESHNDTISEFNLNTSQDLVSSLLGSLESKLLDINIARTNTTPSEYSTNYFMLEVAKNVVGRSLVFTFGYEDNYEIERYIDEFKTSGGDKQKMYSYVDNNGQYTTLKVDLLKNYVVFSDIPEIPDATFLKKYVDRISILPKAELDSYENYATFTFNHYKDNKEIIRQNIQFEFCPANEEIIITDEFMLGHQRVVNKSSLTIRASSIATDIANKTNLPSGTDLDISNLSISISGKTAHITINNLPLDKQYVYIYNHNNGNTLLAWKGNSLYMNLLKDRRKQIYRRDGDNWVIDGEI